MSGEQDNIREQLSAYLDGELSDAEMRRVEAAIESNEQVQAELAQLRRVRELVGSLPSAGAPDGFVERVMARAERNRLMSADVPRQSGAGALHWARLAATAAVLVIAAGTGIVLISTLLRTPPHQTAIDPEKVGDLARDRTQDGDPRRAPGDEAYAFEDAERRQEEARVAAAPPTETPRPAAARDTDSSESLSTGMADKPAMEKESRNGEEPLYRARRGRPLAEGDDYLEQRVVAEARNFDLYVSDVVEANESVINVLNRRGIVVEPPAGNGRATTQQWASNFSRSRAAFANTLYDEQVQIVAFVPAEEMPELLSELRQAASENNAKVMFRQRAAGGLETTTAPARASADDGAKVDELAERRSEREDILLRQLNRQTARWAAGETPTTGQAGDGAGRALAGGLADGDAIAAADVEPLLINLIDWRTVPETLRLNLGSELDVEASETQTQPDSSD